jgi:hypothetical protein
VNISVKIDRLRPEFEDALRAALSCEDPEMNRWGKQRSIEQQADRYRKWITNVADKAHAALKRLYEKYDIRPAIPLGIVSNCIYFEGWRRAGLPSEMPALLTNPKLKEESAKRIEEVLGDLESLDDARILHVHLWSTPEFRAKLRSYATELRALKFKPERHRPRDEEFYYCLSVLTHRFLELTGKQLIDYTAELMEAALGRRVTDMKDSVRHALRKMVRDGLLQVTPRRR